MSPSKRRSWKAATSISSTASGSTATSRGGETSRRGGWGRLCSRRPKRRKRARGQGPGRLGMALPFFMRASWFKKHGYKKADSVGMQVLLWKPFTEDAEPPRWIRKKKTPEPEPGRVTVTALVNGWCRHEHGLRAGQARRGGIRDKVAFRTVDTFDRATFEEWGEPDAVFVDGKGLRMGPPPTYEKIRKTIAKRVKKLG